jgi:hypothetical protein
MMKRISSDTATWINRAALPLSALLVACGAGGGELPGAAGSSSTGPGAGATNSQGGVLGLGGTNIIGVGGATGTTGGSGQGGNVSVSPRQHPNNIDECSSVDGATLSALQGGGSAGAMQWLYPYDETVWPREIAAPIVQWDGGSADAVYLKMTSREFTYQGCFGASSNPHRLAVPQLAWDAAGEWSGGLGDPLAVELSVRSGGTVSTIRQSWTFALAAMKGAVYYNTYTSPLAGTGAVMRLLPGQTQPTVFLTVPGGNPLTGPCISCHSLSADGSTMTANRHDYTPLLTNYQSHSYDVASPQTPMRDNLAEAGFAGIYPDGSLAMTNGPPKDSSLYSPFFPASEDNIPALIGPDVSHVIDPRTGQQIAAPGWDGVVVHAQMPTFSPDGRAIVYNEYGAGEGHALRVADFDRASVTFSNHREIFRDDTRYPAWPFFTPDRRAVVFVLGSSSAFMSQLPGPDGFSRTPAERGQLYIVYLDNPGVGIPLASANGFRGGSSYLPHNDNDREFYTTMSPVAAGGYAWVFFTSRRQYGNTLNLSVENPESKKIWVTAVSLGGGAGDPSHPAFLLPGQEIETGNVRAFAALEPCKEDGQSCQTGTECCNGFCIDGICQPPQECANLDDRCEVSDDCCDPSQSCIGGYCGYPVPR